MTEEPETIDPLEFCLNSAIKWQGHARLSYALIDIMRNDPANFDNADIVSTQEVLKVESFAARQRMSEYRTLLKLHNDETLNRVSFKNGGN